MRPHSRACMHHLALLNDREPIGWDADSDALAAEITATAVRPRPQGPDSPSASELGDMGAPEERDYEKAPKETPPAEGGLGYRGA